MAKSRKEKARPEVEETPQEENGAKMKQKAIYTQKEMDEVKAKVQELEETLKKKDEEVEGWKNKYYLGFADTQNLRKELEKEHQEALRYRSEGFLDKLIPSLDNFYIALAATPNSEEAKNYQMGFKFIYSQIEGALKDEGLVELVPEVNKPFDASYMHALETEEGEEDNLVTKVYTKGYKLYDHLLRPAMVRVSKKKVEEKPEETKPDEA
ncbi:MAG: nucleotide exchange factor GrpE [Bacilli bacterium]|nr:nucleotide exchange factor GrpE [Bacilli bacterium]